MLFIFHKLHSELEEQRRQKIKNKIKQLNEAKLQVRKFHIIHLLQVIPLEYPSEWEESSRSFH